MESFFGRMKERILNLIATCQNFETAKRLIDGYMDTYNNVAYQYNLAGLTPAEFYQYTQTGIYPLAEYFGVDASELGTQKQLIDARIAAARKRNAAEREAYRIKREREQLILSCTPEDVVAQDRKLLLRKLSAQEKVKERTDEKITLIKTILEKTQAAAEFIRAATADEAHGGVAPGDCQGSRDCIHWADPTFCAYKNSGKHYRQTRAMPAVRMALDLPCVTFL
jgi:hypothetical protein